MVEYIEPTDVVEFTPDTDKSYTTLEVKDKRSYKSSNLGFYITAAISDEFKIMKTTYGFVKGFKEKQIIAQEIFCPKDLSYAYYNKIPVTLDNVITLILPDDCWEFPSLRFMISN